MSNESMVRSLYDIFNERAFERGAAMFAADAVLDDMPTGLQRRGAEGYRQYVGRWSTAFPDSKVEVSNVVAAGDQVIVEFRGRGTHTGPLETAMGPVPATGRKVDVPFCETWVVKNGKVASVHSYYDVATFMAQLGLMK